MLVDHWLTPTTEAVHDTHVVLCLSCEASDFPALHERFSSRRIKQTGKDCRAMTAKLSELLVLYCMARRRTGKRRLTQRIRHRPSHIPSQQSLAIVTHAGSRSVLHAQQTRRKCRTISNHQQPHFCHAPILYKPLYPTHLQP
jgi:hypothetical protein